MAQPTNILTFTIRLHDPDEKKDAAKSTQWVVCQMPRADLKMPLDAFIEKYIKPNLKVISLLELS